jgi:large subunit ribosomal protein L13
LKTGVVNRKSINRKWYIIDANNKILGRLASRTANLLTGKGKTEYSPNQDHGDHIIVVNSDTVRLTGNKSEKKVFFRHSKYPSGSKFRSFKEQMALDSRKVVYNAIRGMLPKTVLGRKIFSKLHVYKGGTHPHEAQKPVTLDFEE